MNGYNNYNNYNNFGGGYNPEPNYDYQLYAAMNNEKRLLKKNAVTLGILLLLYELMIYIMGYVFYYGFVSIKSDKLVLNWNIVLAFFYENEHYLYSTAFAMAYNAFVVGTSFVILMIVAKAAFRIDLRSIYRFEKGQGKTVAVCFPAVMLANLTISYVIAIVSWYLSESGIIIPEADFSFSDASPAAFFFQLLYGVILAPIIEETVYRGVIIHLLKPYGKSMAVIISSLIFGLMHGNVAQATNGFCFALVMGTITVYSNSIIPTIGIHILNNAFAELTDISDILSNDLIYEIYLGGAIICLVIGLLVIFAHHRKIRLPKDEGCVLKLSERYKTVMLCLPMLIYWCVIAYDFISSFKEANGG